MGKRRDTVCLRMIREAQAAKATFEEDDDLLITAAHAFVALKSLAEEETAALTKAQEEVASSKVLLKAQTDKVAEFTEQLKELTILKATVEQLTSQKEAADLKTCEKEFEK